MKLKLFVAVVLLTSIATAQSTQQRRVMRPIDNASAVRLQGTLAPRARTELDRGPVAAAMPMQHMSLVFARTAAQQAALDQLLAEQQDRGSSNYHKWLTPEEFGDRFGLAQSDVDLIAAWLTARGFTVDEVARSRTWIAFSGIAAQVEATFQAPIHNFIIDGVMHFAPTTEAAVPDALSSVVAAITGLHDFRPRLHSRVRHTSPRLTSSLSGNHFIVPGDFGTIYDLPDYSNGVFQSGNDGTGQTIGIVGQTSGTNAVAVSTVSSDTATFRTVSGLPTGSLALTPVGTPTTFTSSEADESNLDVQWAGAIAPNAAIIFAYSPNALTTSLQYLVTQSNASVISLSFGDCEANFSSTEIATIEGYLSQANAQGQTVTAAAGDNGATDCDGTAANPATTATHGLAVDYPASSQYVTAMGGIEFTGDSGVTVANGVAPADQYWNSSSDPNDTSASAFSYIPEMVWNDIAATNTNVATGGGSSNQFPKPSWQTGNGVPVDGQRDIPDVSLASSPNHDGYIICSQGSCQTGYRRNSDQTFTVIGGTSSASPSFAGIAALINQKLGARQGNLNPQIYSLAASSPWAFNDITTGDNKAVCTVGTTNCTASPIGYSAAAGYDLATGWGSLTVSALINALTGNPDFSITPSATSLTVPLGGSAAATLNVLGTTGSLISFQCSVSSSLGSTTCSANSVTANGPSPVPVQLNVSTTGTSTATGSVNIQASNGTTTHVVPIAVTLGVPDFTLTIASPVVSIPSGTAITDNLTVASVGGFSSDVALSCSVPSSLGTTTCTISPSTVTGGSGTAVVTLTGAVLTMDRGGPLPFQHRGLGAYATFVFALGIVFTVSPTRTQSTLRAWRNSLLGLLLLCVMFGALSCGGGGSSGGGSGTGPTPITGNVTITGTGGGITHTATINVTVH